MTYRTCMDCGQTILASRIRCAVHQQAREAMRVAKRGNRYGRAHRKAAAEAIAEEPWCHWPGCWSTEDLTADHTPDGYQVLCRSHNSEKANRARAAR